MVQISYLVMFCVGNHSRSSQKYSTTIVPKKSVNEDFKTVLLKFSQIFPLQAPASVSVRNLLSYFNYHRKFPSCLRSASLYLPFINTFITRIPSKQTSGKYHTNFLQIQPNHTANTVQVLANTS